MQERQQREWDTQVAEHGLEEAKRRRAEERDVLRIRNEIPTNELEEVLTEEVDANPDLFISTFLRVNKRLEWQGSLPKVSLKDFDLAGYERHLDEAIKRKDGCNLGWEITQRTVYVKSHHSRARKVPQIIDDFSINEWEKVVILILDQAEEFKPLFDIKIELLADAPKVSAKCSRHILSSDPPEAEAEARTKQPITRIDKLLNQARE
ncbi:hypothetical protein MMC21_008180 [Puttea exsequens]|nr:hypothetical protein [Puttea exsequens]